jgi:acetolactate synthase-1/2/3 large subunit
MFGVPGEENLAVLEVIFDLKIHFLQTRHKQGAALMANVQVWSHRQKVIPTR